MKTLSLLYIGLVLMIANFVVIPWLISARDTVLVLTGFMLILTELGVIIHVLKKKIEGVK